MSAIADSLQRTLLDLVRIPSPIGEEKALCNAIEARLRRTIEGASFERFQDSLLVRLPFPGNGPRIGLIGHLDTVRTEHDGPPRIEGTKLYGAGAADMKSGLALMIELAEQFGRSPTKGQGDATGSPCDVTLVFYEREEGPYDENRLGPMLAAYEELQRLDLAICLEPSDNKLQLGCMGSLQAAVVFHGRTAHSARPWQGENAIHKAGAFLTELGERAPNDVHLDGMLFREVVSATLANGGRGRNIVPDRFELNVNYRFAPGRLGEDVVHDLRVLVGARAEVNVKDLAPGGRPHADHALVKSLIAKGVKAVEPKQAWTDVARFDSYDVPAVNFGPGTQAQAHQRNEYTELPQLIEGYEILSRFLREP